MADNPRFIRVEDAAVQYGVGRDLMKKLVEAGFFPFACKAGERYVIERVPFEAHLEATDPKVRRLNAKQSA